MTEHQLQQAIFTWHWNNRPNERGLLFMVQNTVKSKREGAILKGMGLIAGVSDMIYLRPNGQPIFVELKTAEGRQSPAQIEWAHRIGEAGYTYVVIRSLEEFKALCEEEKKIREGIYTQLNKPVY
jgi:hypothetical protein